MADPTYQPAIYRKQGAAERVIADGGKQTVESGGEIEGQSGGQLDAQAGFQFYMVDTTYLADQLRNFLRSEYTITVHGLSAANDLSGPVGSTTPLITPAYGYHLFSFGGGTFDNASAELMSGSLGDIIVFDFKGLGITSALSVRLLQTNATVSILTNRGSHVSMVIFTYAGYSADTVSTNIFPFLKMVMAEQDKWSVVQYNENVTFSLE